MWNPRLVFDIIWGGSATAFSLIMGLIIGALIGGIADHLGWDGEMAFRLVYLVGTITIFAYLWRESFSTGSRVQR